MFIATVFALIPKHSKTIHTAKLISFVQPGGEEDDLTDGLLPLSGPGKVKFQLPEWPLNVSPPLDGKLLRLKATQLKPGTAYEESDHQSLCLHDSTYLYIHKDIAQRTVKLPASFTQDEIKLGKF